MTNFPRNSDSTADARKAVAELVNVSSEVITEAMTWRKQKASEIQMHAMACGMYPTVAFVDRNFAWFLRWHNKTISKGHLIKRTGVPLQPPNRQGGE